jgi:hypothetical protein
LETKADGTRVIIRSAYEARHFTFPQGELEHFGQIRSGYGSEDVLDEYDGELSYYRQIRRFEREGKRWILLQHSDEYAIEVELTRGQMGEIRRCHRRTRGDWPLDENRYPIEVEPGSA